MISMDLMRMACMSVSAKTSRDARTAVSAIAEGFPTWKPAAPGIGRKSGKLLTEQFEFDVKISYYSP